MKAATPLASITGVSSLVWLSWALILAEQEVHALVGGRFSTRTRERSLLPPASKSSSDRCIWESKHRRQQQLSGLRFVTVLQSMTVDPQTGVNSPTPPFGDENNHNPQQIPIDLNGQQQHYEISHQNGQAAHHNGEPNAVTDLFTPHQEQVASLPSEQAEPKRRKDNPAMADIAFLRKRTSDILHLTAAENLAESDSVGGGDDSEHHPLAFTRGGMKVEVSTFNFLIDGWAFSKESDAADQAMRLLDRMEDLYHQSPGLRICPDVRSYTKVINALSRSKRPDAGELAESILNKMEYISSNGENVGAKPNTHTYTAAIEAWTNSGCEKAPVKTEELLNKMIQRYRSGDPDVVPNARSFNAAISAHAKCDAPGAARHAEHLLDQMDGLYMSGLQEAKPNSFNYNSLISAWANCDDEGSAQRAEEVLGRMEQCYAYGDVTCKPTTVSFNAVIDAYAKSGLPDAAERAEDVLIRMEKLQQTEGDVKPNTRSFNSVMNAWAKSGREDAALKAQDLLEYMQRLYEEGNGAVRPDAHSFCTVINGTYTS